MKFLIDECLHTSLVAVAKDNGYDGLHVNWLGLSGESDWNLMPRIIAENYTFVYRRKVRAVRPGCISRRTAFV